MVRTLWMAVAVSALCVAWQATVSADEPAPGNSHEYIVAIRFVEDQTQFAAPKVRVRDGQSATVLDQTQTPFVVGQTVSLGVRSPVIRVVTEGMSIEVKASSTDAADQVLLELAAEREKIDKVAENGPFQSVRTASVKKRVLENVRLGEKTRIEFPGRELEIVVTLAE